MIIENKVYTCRDIPRYQRQIHSPRPCSREMELRRRCQFFWGAERKLDLHRNRVSM